jgi:hypothetical protein
LLAGVRALMVWVCVAPLQPETRWMAHSGRRQLSPTGTPERTGHAGRPHALLGMARPAPRTSCASMFLRQAFLPLREALGMPMLLRAGGMLRHGTRSPAAALAELLPHAPPAAVVGVWRGVAWTRKQTARSLPVVVVEPSKRVLAVFAKRSAQITSDQPPVTVIGQ